MRRLIVNIPLLTIVASLIFLVSVFASACTKDWTWFSRSGSITTLIGAAFVTRPILRLGVAEYHKQKRIIDGGWEGDDYVPPDPNVKSEDYWDDFAEHLGFWFIVCGTVIWGYGDLINTLF